MSTPFFRAIPVLLMRDSELYKGVNFKKYNYIGDPINAVKIFNAKEVDELVILDIGASKSGDELNYEYIESIVSEAFMPVAYGGGIRNVEHAKQLFNLGVEKVVVNTGFLDTPNLVEELSSYFGRQSILVSIDYRYDLFGRRKVFSHSKRRVPKSLSVEKLIEKAVKLGAGEVVLNCSSLDGTMNGMDIDFIKQITNQYNVNLIPIGGAGSFEHIVEVSSLTNARACGVGSYFVYQGVEKSVMINYLSNEQKVRLG